MSQQLELIVKKFVPFVGDNESAGFDHKERAILPKHLVDILLRRQKVDDKRQIDLFYKLNVEEKPKFLELTDYFPTNIDIDFSKYRFVKLDTNSRILVAKRDLSKIGFNDSRIVYVGDGNKILVYKAEDYQENHPTP